MVQGQSTKRHLLRDLVRDRQVGSLDAVSRLFVLVALILGALATVGFLVSFLVLGQRSLAWSAVLTGVLTWIAGYQTIKRRYRPMLIAVAALILSLLLALIDPEVISEGLLVAAAALAVTAALLQPARILPYLAFVALVIAAGIILAHDPPTTSVWLGAALAGSAILATGLVFRLISAMTVAQEARLSSMISSAPEAILVADADGSIRTFNRAAEDMFGYPASDVTGRPVEELMPKRFREGHPAYRAAFAKEPIAGRVMDRRPEFLGLRSIGEEFPIAVSISKIGHGADMEFTAIIRDITEMEQSRQELLDLVESKNLLIASISHEIRTPLTGVLGFAQLLQDETSGLSNGEKADMLRSILEEGTDLANVVDDLLAYAKQEADLLEMVRVRVDLRAQSAQVIENLHTSHRGSLQFRGDPVFVTGDPARVRQVIRNLVVNALKYGEDPVILSIGSDETTGWVQVTDSGPGVSEEDRSRIFLPYQRATDQVGVTQSLGLGLAISRDLAWMMSGDLTYRREQDQTVFELSLPLDE